jgi:hypothetical protein
MKKSLFVLLFVFSILSTQLNAQIKGNDYKIILAPELTHMLNGDNSKSRGVGMGFTGGLQVDFNFYKPTYLVAGINFTRVSFTRWKVDKGAAYKAVDDMNCIEIPMGIGFNISRKKFKQLYTNFTFIHNFTLDTKTETTKPEIRGFNLSYAPNGAGFYTPGLKGEFGFTGGTPKKNQYTIGLSAKSLMWNWNKTNTDQFNTFSLALVLGVII